MKLKLASSLACAALALPAWATDVTYRNDIAPLIKVQCGECHGDDSPALVDFLLDQEKFKKAKKGPRTSTYGDLIQLIGWPDSGAFMRRLDDGTNTADKKPGNMHRYVGDTEAERAANLSLIKVWLGGEGTWSLNRWEKRGDVPAVSKEQLNNLKIKY